MNEYRERLFWNKVALPDENGCLKWLGHVTSRGYGQFGIGNKTVVNAHRYAYELLVSEIPAGLVIDHLCRVRNCVNPNHLEAVTPEVNSRRGLRGYSVDGTRCKRGHDLTLPNAMAKNRGRWTRCRKCGNDKRRERRLEQRRKAGDYVIG